MMIEPGTVILVCYGGPERLKEYEGMLGKVYSVSVKIGSPPEYVIEVPITGNLYIHAMRVHEGQIVKATKIDKFLYEMLGKVPCEERNKARVISKDSKAKVKVAK